MLRNTELNSVTIHDLKPGDIIFHEVRGIPHASIFAPIDGEVSDLVHVSYATNKSGGIKSTLSRQLQTDPKTIVAFRSKRWDGEEIAKQAEFWIRQGIVFDERRLANSLYDEGEKAPSLETNIMRYLLCAARRETMPIKVHRYPYNYTDFPTSFSLAMLFPDFEVCRPLSYLFKRTVDYGTSSHNRPKGMSCIMFILFCLAAVALKDEINPVNKNTGWVSLKYSPLPADNESEFAKILRDAKEEIGNHNHGVAGMEALLSEEQMANFNIDRLVEKLTPTIAGFDLHKPSPLDFMHSLLSDKANWECLGTIDKTVLKEFDKDAYREEQLKIQQETVVNRQRFIEQFSDAIFNHDGEEQRKFSL